MELLKGKVALITGAARGIGKQIALKFAAEGADIAFTDLAIDAIAEQTKTELETFGVRVLAIASNAADFTQAHDAVQQVMDTLGRIDILVNNAGITRDGLMLRMNEAQWDAVLTVNLKSAFNFIHAVSPVMLRQRGGSIINISSIVGVHGNAGQCNYSASKAGMIGLAKSIAAELGPKGVRANVVAPGFIMTAVEILEANRLYTDEELRKLLSGHLCRCTGYENIFRAVKKTMYRRLGMEIDF